MGVYIIQNNAGNMSIQTANTNPFLLVFTRWMLDGYLKVQLHRLLYMGTYQPNQGWLRLSWTKNWAEQDQVSTQLNQTCYLFVHSPSQPDSWPRGNITWIGKFNWTQWAKLSAAMLVYHGVSQHLIWKTCPCLKKWDRHRPFLLGVFFKPWAIGFPNQSYW